MNTPPSGERLDALVAQSRLLVCCGPGGVGKTTTAAAIALRAADQGRTTLVMTIDPARRLATCLGLEQLASRPHRVDTRGGEGELWAMMLDTRETFDHLIERLAPDEETAQQIKKSRLYGIFAGSMHGTSDYMALESLFDAYTSERYDLVLLDTPPLVNALDFFRATKRASWLFDERILRWFVPKQPYGRLRRLFTRGGVVLGLLSRLMGPVMAQDLADFFGALEVLREEFKRRSDGVDAILRYPDTRYLVVTSGDERRIEEALYLEEQLERLDQAADLFVLNRCHLQFAGGDGAIEAAVRSNRPATLVDEAGFQAWLAEIERLHGLLAASGRRQHQSIARLADRVGAERICTVPELAEDGAGLGRQRGWGGLFAGGCGWELG